MTLSDTIKQKCICGKNGHPMNSLVCPIHGKKQMIRKEACDKIRFMNNNGEREWLLDNLQALGLIKFEEEKKASINIIIDILTKMKNSYNEIPISAAGPEIAFALKQAGLLND